MTRVLVFCVAASCVLGGILADATRRHLAPLPESLDMTHDGARPVRYTDRNGAPLNVTYQTDWNTHDWIALADVPALLATAFIYAEDKRFFDHGGADWLARLNAAVMNLRAQRVVRGASTISEQVVRMRHPRPRTVWSRWLEGWDAARFERRFGKQALLEWYLNEVPYAHNRRGVVQAARMYFGRDIDTLNAAETLALAVLVRAPSRLDLLRNPRASRPAMLALARRLRDDGVLTETEYGLIHAVPIRVAPHRDFTPAEHFVRYLDDGEAVGDRQTVTTTLDAELQRRVHELLTHRIAELEQKGVTHGAALVVDHTSDEILAWVSVASDSAGTEWFDAVRIPRQPGSTLKPFVYALALERGWTAATIIDDAPLTEAVGAGVHAFRNYSRTFHGPLRVREALGNSLNIPAVRTATFVGHEAVWRRLRRTGFASLIERPDYYGTGLALGNGGVTLYELVRAYAALARGGLLRDFHAYKRGAPAFASERVFTAPVSAIIADILADPYARTREFGDGLMMRFPSRTALKTGTSTQYHDAWAVGFNGRYTAGLWMGALTHDAMAEVTGAMGPMVVLRGIFAELPVNAPLSAVDDMVSVARVAICRTTGLHAGTQCPRTTEYFVP